MKKITTILLTSILIIGVLLGAVFGIFYYSIKQIDFIGNKDPKAVESNIERWEKMLLSAEFRDQTDYFKINILDSVNIEINAGDAAAGVIMTKEYKISGDTIIILGNIKHAEKYMNSRKLLILEDQILYLKNGDSSFDTIRTMKIKFNRIMPTNIP